MCKQYNFFNIICSSSVSQATSFIPNHWLFSVRRLNKLVSWCSQNSKREIFLLSRQTGSSLSQNWKCSHDAYQPKLTFLSGRFVSHRSETTPRGFSDCSVCMVGRKHDTAKRPRMYLLLRKNMKKKEGFASTMTNSLYSQIRFWKLIGKMPKSQAVLQRLLKTKLHHFFLYLNLWRTQVFYFKDLRPFSQLSYFYWVHRGANLFTFTKKLFLW